LHTKCCLVLTSFLSHIRLCFLFGQSFFRMGSSAEYVELATSERHQAMLSYLFDHLVSKFEVAIGVRSPNNVLPVPGSVVGSGTGTGVSGGKDLFLMNSSVHSDTPGSNKYDKFTLTTTTTAAANNATALTNTDGIAAIAMLTVLTEFEVSYREAMVVQFANNLSGINAPTNVIRPGNYCLNFLCVSCFISVKCLNIFP